MRTLKKTFLEGAKPHATKLCIKFVLKNIIQPLGHLYYVLNSSTYSNSTLYQCNGTLLSFLLENLYFHSAYFFDFGFPIAQILRNFYKGLAPCAH